MKKLIRYTFTLTAVLLLAGSCEDWDFLQEKPKQAGADNFLQNAKSVEAEVNAIYYQLARNEAFGRYLSVLSESLSDYCYGRGNFASTYDAGLTVGGQGFSKDTWAVLYRAIRYANGILADIDKVSLTESEYKSLTAEIRYLRAFSYSYLVRYFGAVPFFNEKNMNEFSKPRTSEQEMWNFILTESKYAIDNLPETVTEIGRPTKYAALMLETEAAMYLKDYATAATACGTIISSGKYSLVKVTTADDFDKLYGYEANGTSEEIYYIKYNRDVGNTFEWMYLCKPNPVSATGALGIYTDYVKNNVIVGWDKKDLRYQHNLYHSTNGTLMALTKNGFICLKYRDPKSDLSTMATDWPVYRYADALLYNAEAICRRDGQPNETAMEMINKVHRRAYGLDPETVQTTDYKLADYATLDKFIELLLKEKVYEQCFEGKRYCDLKRQGLLAEYAVRAGRVASVADVKDAAYWWPIPDDEFNYNNYLDPAKDQNPGY